MKKWLWLGMTFCAVQSVSVLADVHVKDAWLREPVPGRDISAVFMQLHNGNENEVVLVSASAPWAESIEIHTHINDSGVMRMRQLPELAMAADETVIFQPGGLHLMVFGIQDPLPTSPEITLCYQHGECQTIGVALRAGGNKPYHSGHGQHAQHGH